MTILTIAQNAAATAGLEIPASLYGGTSQTQKQLLALLNSSIEAVCTAYPWPELRQLGWLKLRSGQDKAVYTDTTIPDIDYVLPETEWIQADFWPVTPPISTQAFNARAFGATARPLRYKYLWLGYRRGFLIQPAPQAADEGKYLFFYYQSRSWLKPASWAPNTAYTATATAPYVQYDGRVYKGGNSATSGQTTGSVAMAATTNNVAMANAGMSVATVSISGTWTGTLCIETSTDSGTTWSTLCTFTNQGAYERVIGIEGKTNFRVRCYAVGTGTATVTRLTTPPSHLYGSVLDGATGVGWTLQRYDSILADADSTFVEEDLVEAELTWRLLRAKGVDYGGEKQEAEQDRAAAFGRNQIGGSISINGCRATDLRFISERNMKDTGYGS